MYAKNSILTSIFILAVLSVIQSDVFPFYSESQERRGLFTVVPEGLSGNKWAENEQGNWVEYWELRQTKKALEFFPLPVCILT